MNTTPSTTSQSTQRALVLHGGGSLGNAWEIGVVAGLLDAGVDVTKADLIVGTSAGATAAAQITSAHPRELLDAILSAAPPQRTGPVGSVGGSAPTRPAPNHLERTNQIIAAAQDAADMRRRMGAAALELDAVSDDSASGRWRSITASRLTTQSWPVQRILITAVDARTGKPVVFDRDGGVDLVDAIAASTSSGAPYRLGDARYIDGGYRRNENADLAVGYERVLVLSPFGGRSRHPMEWGMQLSAQVEELRASGSMVETILPDADSLAVFGDNMMDASRRPLAAQAGYSQGKAVATELSEFWRFTARPE
jgi:NTE family protein